MAGAFSWLFTYSTLNIYENRKSLLQDLIWGNYNYSFRYPPRTPCGEKCDLFSSFWCQFMLKLGGFRIFLQTHISPRPPSRVEHFGALIGRARGSHHVVISYRKWNDTSHSHAWRIQASALRRDGIIGQGRYVCQNTQLATGISVMHRLVQKYETLPVLPKKLTETQEKSALFSRRGVLG